MADFRSANGHNGYGFDASRSEPEILPPGEYPPSSPQHQPPPVSGYGTGYVPGPVPGPVPPPRPRRSHWAAAPATYILLGINCAVFLGMVFSGVSVASPNNRALLLWGAGNGTLELGYGQWWRLLSAMFVHIGIIHLASNMWCLWNLGLLGEPLLGPFGIFAAYLLTGFSGNLLSTAVHPGINGGPESIVGAGASGAIFGLAGVLIVLLKSPLLPIPPLELKKLRRSVIYFAGLNFIIGAGTWISNSPIQVDNMAHLGGFLSGLALGVPLVPRIGAPRQTFERRRTFAVLGMAFLLLLLAFGVYSFWR